MALLERKTFIGHAGWTLRYKIECDALSDEDIETIASRIADDFSFGEVLGVPRGGVRLASALTNYANAASKRLLIVDDVLTRGTSMQEARLNVLCQPDNIFKFEDIFGIVIFARGDCPEWIYPFFTVAPWAWR